jgi:hypothetical protein
MLACVLAGLCFLCMGAAKVFPGEPMAYEFSSTWCAPCQQIKADVDTLIAAGYPICKIDIDRDPATAAKFGITCVPTAVVIQDGKVFVTTSGVGLVETLKLKLHRKAQPTSNPGFAPHPAWRYEWPTEHRAAVCRLYCKEPSESRCIGSGTLVRWAGRVVLLTARHVVKDATEIVVWVSTGKSYRARVLRVDATWDCAVLEVVGLPADAPTAEVELGNAALQQEGNRLESCGYGGDGKLAANTGLFIGYRRIKGMSGGPDDWFEISGHAREGDSGGPVFNARGRVVGVLWGINGEVVVCVQAGRLHLLLNSAVGLQQHSYKIHLATAGPPLDPSTITKLQYRPLQCGPGGCPTGRCPTPPANNAVPTPIEELPQVVPGPIFDASSQSGGYLLPGRQKLDDEIKADAAKNAATMASMERQIAGLAQAAAANRPVVPPPVPPTADLPAEEAKENEVSPIVAVAVILAAAAVGAVFFHITRKKSN